MPRWTLDAKERSLIGEQLILLMRQAYRARGGAAIIGITDYEMYATREDRRHVFSWRAPPYYGVVSTSSLAANVLDRLRGHSRHERAASSSPATSASSTTAVMRATIRTVSFARRCMETATSTSSRRLCKTSPPRRSARQAAGGDSGSSSCSRRASCTMSRAAALALKLPQCAAVSVTRARNSCPIRHWRHYTCTTQALPGGSRS